MRGLPTRFLWYSVLLGLLLISILSGRVPADERTLVVLVLCACLELLDSSLGMGYGTTLTPVLLLFGFDPHQLVPTILISEFLSGFASSFFHSEAGNVRFSRGSPHLRAAVILSLCSVVGVGVGVSVSFGISTVALKRVIGIIILGAGIAILATAGRTFAFRPLRVVVLAIVASFNKAMSGGGYGPLLTSGQIVSGIEGRAAVAITSLAEGFTCLVGTVLFLVAGRDLDPGLLIPVVLGALASVPVSARVVRRIPERGMRWSIGILTLGLGVLTLAKAF